MDQSSFDLTFWVAFSTTSHFVAFLAVTLHALRRRRNASATILWIFVAWSLPVFGPLLYLAFGIDRVMVKGLEREIDDQSLKAHREERLQHEDPFHAWYLDHRVVSEELDPEISRGLNQSIDALTPDHPLLGGNRITPLISGDEAYPLMLEAIRAAKHHVHLQSFIIHRDATGRAFLDALKAKAEQGVKVRVLFDRFGSTHAYLGRMFAKYEHVPNLEIRGWTQANPFKAQFQINLRNHRKNLVIDGRSAFFGGVNIAGDNTTNDGREAIRDYHFHVEGPLVHELQFSFLSDWYFMTRQPVETLIDPALFPRIARTGAARARLIDSGPSSSPGRIGEAFFNAIILAREQIVLVTPYFVPTTDLLKALRSAARRGVDTRLIVPRVNNHLYAGLASKALFEELLEAGVRVFLREPPFLHAKAMIVDDAVALVGTANLDVRSLELNYETTILIDDPATAGRLKSVVHEDLLRSEELDLNTWTQRPRARKLAENLAALMTPVL